MVKGILSIVFSEIPGVGIILGAKARKEGANATDGKAKAGRILGTIGLILNIVCTAYYILLAILMMAGQ